MKKLKKILFIPDCHHPYVDQKAWDLMLNAARRFRPDQICILGDFADFYSVSSHSKSPNRVSDLKDEVDAVNYALDELDSLRGRAKIQKVFIAGNHEDRLERYLADKAPELFNVVRIPQLFKLKERKWIYIPYKSDYRLGKLYLTHDTGVAGRSAVFKNLEAYQHSIIGGHTHRLQYIVEGNAKGVAHVSATFGWLGDLRKVDYMHRVKAARDWAHGFGIGYQTPDGKVYVTPIPIVNYTCIIEGDLVTL